jgi:hypothetical protein
METHGLYFSIETGIELDIGKIPVVLDCLVAVTKYLCLGGLNDKNLFPNYSESTKSEIKVPAWLGSVEDSLPGLHMAIFSLYPHMVFPQYMDLEKGRE